MEADDSTQAEKQKARGTWPRAFCSVGGETGIRTRGGSFDPHSLSRRAPSASSAISPELSPCCWEFDLGKNSRAVTSKQPPVGNRLPARNTSRGGGSRIRTYVPFPGNGFQDRRFKPLSHPSSDSLRFLSSCEMGVNKFLGVDGKGCARVPEIGWALSSNKP